MSDRKNGVEFPGHGEAASVLAHLLRKAISFSERDGPSGAIGRELLDSIAIIFGHWNGLKDGTLRRSRVPRA